MHQPMLSVNNGFKGTLRVALCSTLAYSYKACCFVCLIGWCMSLRALDSPKAAVSSMGKQMNLDPVRTFTATWRAPRDTNVIGYVLTCWNNTFTNLYRTRNTFITISLTNTGAVYFTVQSTNILGDRSVKAKVDPDTITIYSEGGSVLLLESYNMRNWQVFTNAPVDMPFPSTNAMRLFIGKGKTNRLQYKLWSPYNPAE